MEGLLLHYGYWISFPLAVIEGPIVTVIAGAFVYLGKFNIYIILSIITLADVLTDIRYRWIGTKVNSSRRVQRYITKSDLLKNHLSTMKHFWARHTGKTMFLGKQAYGLSVPIIISAGMCHMPLQRFLAYSIPVSFVQGSILLFVGYHLGSSYELASKYISYPGLIALCLFILIILGYRKTTKYVATYFDKQHPEETTLLPPKEGTKTCHKSDIH